MELNQQDIDALNHIINQRGFKVLENIVKDMEYNLLKDFKTADLAKEETGYMLNGVQNKLAGAEELLSNAKAYCLERIEKEV